MVADVLSQRRLQVQEVTEFYLVNLLAGFLEKERLFVEEPDGTVTAEPLALILLRALASERRARAAQLKRLGDTALFVSGFFGDSLARSLVDVDYYIAMGERAYGALAEMERELVFEELSGRFGDFVDLFAEIAELSDLRSNRGLVRLYERFLATRSERIAQALRDRGVALFSGPGAPPGRRLLQ
jgi:small basic protein